MNSNHIVIAGANLPSRLARMFMALIPPSWLKRMLGPTTTVVLTPEGGRVVADYNWLRPIHVLLSPDLVMRRRLALPAAMRADLAGSIDVMVETATPFTPAELLIYAEETNPGDGDDELIYSIHLTPRDRIEEALAAFGLPRWRVAKVAPLETTELHAGPDFAPALGSVGRIRRYALLLPFVAVAIALFVLGQAHIGSLRSENTALELAISDREVAIRSSLSTLAERQDASAAQAAIDDASAEVPSVFLLLEDIRASLPQQVLVSRLSIDGASLRLDVQAPEILQVVRHLADTMPDWTVSVEGPIARSQDGAAEVASLLFRWSIQ